MKIIFFGTPDFAVTCLDILVQARENVVGVVTSVDKYGGRGRKTLIESAVKKYAVSKGLNILQPTNLKSKGFNETLAALEADLQVVVAFRMLPEMVWNRPSLGTYNLHGSLLPAYRGAAPINWAIINGETTTGVTSFKLKHEIDTGSILLQKEIPIYPDDTAGDLHDRMKWVAAEVVYDTVQKLKTEDLALQEQTEALVSHAPKLNMDNTKIDFHKPTKQVHDLVRGLSPYPTAWCHINRKKTKLYAAIPSISAHNQPPGLIETDNKTYLKIATSDGYLDILELQLSGKKRMKVRELLNGYNIDVNQFA